MSVHYYLNESVTIGDLKKANFKVEKNEEPYGHPYVVSSDDYDSGVAIIFTENTSDNEDELKVSEFEGRFSHGGGIAMCEMCDRLNRLFITDEDIDDAFYSETYEITEDTFKNRTENFRKFLQTPPKNE